MKILVDPFDEAEKLTLQNGDWVVGVVETRIFWPKKKHTIHYADKDFILLPCEPHEKSITPTLPAIAIKTDVYGLSKEEARREIMRLASAIAWQEGQKLEIVGFTGGNLPRSMGIARNNAVTEYLDGEYLPAPEDEKARAALAFYREGMSLDNPFYSFLSFYKAFTVAIPDGRERDAWMTSHRGSLNIKDAKDRLAELESEGAEVGKYLYEQCRHAIAHADKEPFVNPDDTDDHYRLAKDLPIMRRFARIAIEESFGVKSTTTIYREHLHELEGFRDIISVEIIDAFKQQKGAVDNTKVELPDEIMLIGKRRHENYPLNNMVAFRAGWTDDGLMIDFRSSSGRTGVRVFLDFLNEKLLFDPMSGFGMTPDRSSLQGAHEELAGLNFQRCILSNGHLEIWDVQEEKRLGCTESYLPHNCMVNTEFFDEEAEELEKIISSLQ